MASSSWVFRLECGDRAVDLLSTPSAGWSIAEGGVTINSVPSQVIYSDPIGYSGRQRLGTVYDDTKITLQAHLLKQSGAAALQKNIHDVMRFITDAQMYQEGKTREPVYLVRRLNEGYSGTGNNVVLFGRGNIYHEVKSIDSIEIPGYTVSLTKSTSHVIGVTINLTCSPFGYSKPAWMPQSQGWVRFNENGDIHIWEATTNLFTNPSFEHETYSTNWTLGTNLTGSVEYNDVYSGFQACRLVNTDASTARAMYEVLTLTNTTVYTISCYTYAGGTAITSSICQLFANSAAITTTYTADADKTGWYRLTGSVTGDGIAKWHGVITAATKSVIVDCLQIEAKSYVTPFTLDGASVGPGVTWAGVTNASTQTRVAGVYRAMIDMTGYTGYKSLNPLKGGISIWVKMSTAGDDGLRHDILDTGASLTSNRHHIYKDTTGDLIFDIFGSTTSGSKRLSFTTDSTSWPANTWVLVVATWDTTGPTGLYLYYGASSFLSDTSVTSSGTWTDVTTPTSYIFWGSTNASNNQFNGWLSDAKIYGPDATITPASIYAAGRGRSIFPFQWQSTLGTGLGNNEAEENHFYVANVPGDYPARCRLGYISYDFITSSFYIGLKTMPRVDLRIGECAGSAQAGTTASQSGSQVRVGATGGSKLALYNLSKTWRDREFVSGRYRALAKIVNNGSTGEWKARLVCDGVTGDWKQYTTVGSDARTLDLGIFSIPAIEPISVFADQSRGASGQSGCLQAYLDASSLTGASRFDMYYLQLIPEYGGYIPLGASLQSAHAFVIDSINNPKSAYFVSGDDNMNLQFSLPAYIPWLGKIPILTNNSWMNCTVSYENTTLATGAPAISIGFHYQAAWGWGL